MDRFKAIQIFIKVAEQGGFAKAARHLSLSAPAVTRAVAQLEDRLGTRLFIRTTRSVRLSQSGERFLQDGQRLLLDLQQAEDAAVGVHGSPQGLLRITAPVMFGRQYVNPILGDFLDHYTDVTAEALYLDRIVNFMDEGIDVAIRIGHLPDSSLTAVQVGRVRRQLFAAPKYLNKNGRPEYPSDLAHHQIIHALGMGSSKDLIFQDNKKPILITTDPRLSINTLDAVIEQVLLGRGISNVLSYQIASYLNDGRLEVLLQNYEMPPLPIHVVHQEGRRVSAKVRTFVDFIVERLRADKALN